VWCGVVGCEGVTRFGGAEEERREREESEMQIERRGERKRRAGFWYRVEGKMKMEMKKRVDKRQWMRGVEWLGKGRL